jgi:hypothetical protein
MDEKEESSPAWPRGWEEHKADQIVFIARNSTPLQRIRWLESMLELLRPQLPAMWQRREAQEAERRARRVAERAAADGTDQAKAVQTPAKEAKA